MEPLPIGNRIAVGSCADRQSVDRSSRARVDVSVSRRSTSTMPCKHGGGAHKYRNVYGECSCFP